MDRLGHPHQTRLDLREFRARLQPEVHGHQRGDVAAEAVDAAAHPDRERVDEVPRQVRVRVGQVDDVRPRRNRGVRDAVRVPVEELRVLGYEHAVLRRVVEDDVEHHLQPGGVRRLDERVEVLLRPQVRVQRPVVPDRVRAPRRTLPAGDADRVDRQEVQHVHAERTDPVEVRRDVRECPAGAVVAREDLIDHERAGLERGVGSHVAILPSHLVRRAWIGGRRRRPPSSRQPHLRKGNGWITIQSSYIAPHPSANPPRKTG